jgi:hypothetical protein
MLRYWTTAVRRWRALGRIKASGMETSYLRATRRSRISGALHSGGYRPGSQCHSASR